MSGLVDKSLSFGMQNWFFVQQDETDLTYIYVAYQDKKGAVLIGRYKKDDTEARYCVKTGTLATIWAGRTGYTYQLPGQLIDPTL